MAENSHIEWTDHTFNPWIGCTKVSEGCSHCYAELRDRRHMIEKVDHWGKGAPRLRTKPSNWKKPLEWNRAAGRGEFGQCWPCGRRGEIPAGGQPCPSCGCVNTHHYSDRETGAAIRPRVFSASLADWLDDEVPIAWLADLMELIHETPNLDWLLLTKRPQNWRERMHQIALGMPWRGVPLPAWEQGFETREFARKWIEDGTYHANVWLGTSVENQKAADERIPALLQIPAHIRFLSCEPLLGKVEIGRFPIAGSTITHDPLTAVSYYGWGEDIFASPSEAHPGARLHWLIAGGESGPNARPMHPDWARSLRDQCTAAGVPFFFKQWGEFRALDISPESFALRDLAKKRERPCVQSPGSPLVLWNLGKKAAGRQLDGREWSQFPVPSSAIPVPQS